MTIHTADIPGYHLTYKDFFNLKAVYKNTHKWLSENSFKDDYNSTDYIEKRYIHKESGGVYEINVVWKASREYKSPHYKIECQIEFLLIAGRQEERVIGGNKYKGETGELNVFITFKLKVDDKGAEKSPFLKKQVTPVLNRHMKEEMEALQEYAYKRETDLYNFLKNYLETMQAFQPQEQLFHRKWDDV